MNFFALRDDLKLITNFMFEELGFTIYETYSRFDSDIREFTPDSNLQDFEDLRGNVRFCAWVGSCKGVAKFELIKSAKPELFTFRTRVHCISQVQIIQNGYTDQGHLRHCNIGHWTEAGVNQRGAYSEEEISNLDWNLFNSVTRKLKYHIRKRLAVAKLHEMPVLPAAFSELNSEKYSLQYWGKVVPAYSNAIEVFD